MMIKRQLTLSVFFLFITLPNISFAAVIIQYHHISNDTPRVTSVSPVTFSKHMRYLAENNFQVWPLNRLVDTLKEGKPLPDRVISITFDDSYSSIYTHAFPVLKQYHFPFTVFINPTLTDNNIFMSWNQLRELAAHGGTIANHGLHHSHMIRRTENESITQWQQRIKDQLLKAEDIIEKEIGNSTKLLAYTYGEYNNRLKAIAKANGMTAFAQHSGAFNRDVDWQAIPRFAFGGDYADVSGFIDKVNSLPMPLVSAIVKDERGNKYTDPLLANDNPRPILTLILRTPDVARQVQCFASGQGQLKVNVDNDIVTTRPKNDLPVGRSRINCTAPSTEPGRYYWYSQFFIRKNTDGSWYKEP